MSKSPLLDGMGGEQVNDEDKDNDQVDKDSNRRNLRKNPPLTPAGKDNLIITLKSQIKSCKKRLERQQEMMEPLLTSNDIAKINNETTILDRIYNDITEFHTRLCQILDGEEDREEMVAAMIGLDVVDSGYFSLKTRLCNWQLECEKAAQKKAEDDDVSSTSSQRSKASSCSSKSKSSSKSSKSKRSKASDVNSACSNKSLELKAKIAGLMAESEAMKRTSEAKLAARLLKKQEQICKMQAMEKVYSDVEDPIEDIKEEAGDVSKTESKEKMQEDTRKVFVSEPPQKKLKPSKEEKGRTVAYSNHHAEANSDPNLYHAVTAMIKLQSAPKPDLDVFTGKPLDYPFFKATFKEVVEKTVDDQVGRLTRLIKYTNGDAKDLIAHLIHASPLSCYDEAIKMLDNEYGNPHLIHRSYISELRKWDTIKANDTPAYKKLYRFLLKCQTYKTTYKLAELDSTDVIQTVIRKVPAIQERWNRKAVNIRRDSARDPVFSDLLKFMEYEVALLSDPSYSKDALAESKQLKANFAAIDDLSAAEKPASKGKRDLPTPPPQQPSEESNKSNITFSPKCPLCSALHDIEQCSQFISLGTDERHRTVFKLRLCFSCLAPVTQEHNGKSCTSKRNCLVCQENHPTTLHDGKGLSVHATSVPSMSISMCVVQVQVWHKDNPDTKATVYALLDECSNGTFIKDSLLDIIKIPQDNIGPNLSLEVTTVIGAEEQNSGGVKGLVVQATGSHLMLYGDRPIPLPYAHCRPSLAVGAEEIPTPSRINRLPHLRKLMDIIPDYDPSIPIGLMIGGNCAKANETMETIPSTDDGPYAKRTRLGWCVVGPIASRSENQVIQSFYTNLRDKIPVRDILTNKIANHTFVSTTERTHDPYTSMLKQMYNQDFNEPWGEKEGLSVEDRRFLQTMETSITLVDGHYELPIPLRNPDLKLPNNRIQAMSRLSSIKRKLLADDKLREKYVSIIQKMISSGYARVADTSKDPPGRVWTIPHFVVYSSKTDKYRVVFDFAAKFKGRCLNDELIQGPNLANLMIGVILRFRKEEVAYMADIEAMYHQVKVPEDQRSLLRFLFWPNGNLDANPVDMEMCVHAFGAVSSGSCAIFALNKSAEDGESTFGEDAAYCILRNFYIDDHLKSVPSVKIAAELFPATRNMCAAKGFNLTKFISNSSELNKLIPSECHAPSLVDLSMSKQPVPLERALGIFWCIEDDTLRFRIILQDKPLTPRGVLSTVGSVHDPNGVAGPFILLGRLILQKITKGKVSWDDPLSPDLRAAWEKWRAGLPQLEELKIQRCYKPPGFKTESSSIHSFSDASELGYGMVTYLRQVSTEGEVCVAFVMAKSRVVPGQHSVPRTELTAADVSAQITAMVKEELDMPLSSETYWSDSTVALGYIRNETKCFRTFVANRQSRILRLTNKEDWKHVDTKNNPADYASRGLTVSEHDKVQVWLRGPEMLWQKEDPARNPCPIMQVADDDPEVLTTVSCNAVVVAETNSVLNLLDTFPSWDEVKETVATASLFLSLLRKEREVPTLTVDDLVKSENRVIRMLQDKYFPKERECLKTGTKVMKSSPIIKLDPFLDENQLLRVGGRLRRGNLDNKHPVILPKNDSIVYKIIQHYHEDIAHLGRTSTLNELRLQDYWVINGGAQVRKLVDRCRRCKELRGQPETQKMADLPEERTTCAEPPFTYCGADMFGPFITKEGRKELKRYGVIFTCYSCRGVHIEMTASLDTDAFILALRRFLSRRGPVRSIRSDNGGNFIGVEEEMRKGLQEMDMEKIRKFLLDHSCDWIQWEKNPPESSHMGGVWERQIRTVRSVLSSLLKDIPGRLDDESLRTLFTEVEAIVNSRPLAVDNLNDETSDPLTPNHLLTMKSKVVLPPPGVFQQADIYCRKRWRAVQHLANEFWQQYSKEYVRVSQVRSKWNNPRRNITVNDIVLVLDKNLPRNRWSKGRVVEVFPSDDGLVRAVNVKTGPNTVLKRPVTKLVVIVPSE